MEPLFAISECNVFAIELALEAMKKFRLTVITVIMTLIAKRTIFALTTSVFRCLIFSID